MKTDFIKYRQEEFIKRASYMKLLFDFLEDKIENSMVVPMPESIEEVFHLISRGETFNNKVILKKMENSRCHENSSNIFKREPNKYRIITGYGYTKEDNMWRQHTWILRLKDNTIIETTVKRDVYFGILLTEEESISFANY